MYFVIGGDFVPTMSNLKFYINCDRDSLFGDKLNMVLDGASYRIFNLETPLANKYDPILKQGPNLIAPTDTISLFKKIHVDLFTLANNHIMDQGVQGLFSTLKELDKAEIEYVGVGEKLSTASKPFVFSFSGKNIGVYACAEHEFSIAKDDYPGANPFDSFYSFDHVQNIKQKVDYVIVLYHGGKEQYRYPSPNLQKTCRRFIEKGANIVICQHSHCIGCEEDYKDGKIVYG